MPLNFKCSLQIRNPLHQNLSQVLGNYFFFKFLNISMQFKIFNQDCLEITIIEKERNKFPHYWGLLLRVPLKEPCPMPTYTLIIHSFSCYQFKTNETPTLSPFEQSILISRGICSYFELAAKAELTS